MRLRSCDLVPMTHGNGNGRRIYVVFLYYDEQNHIEAEMLRGEGFLILQRNLRSSAAGSKDSLA